MDSIPQRAQPPRPESESGSPERLRAIAFHEAGHAVMAWHLGLRFRSVTVRPARGCCGWVWLAPTQVCPARSTPGEAWEHWVLVRLAGPLAAWPLERRFRSLSARRDLECAFDRVQALATSPAEALARWSALKERAWNTLAQEPLWQALNALAEALLARGTLTGREAQGLITAAVEAAGPPAGAP